MAAILESDLAARGGRTYFSVNCLLHILINYTENVTDLYAHAQTVDTRRSSLIFQAPGYKANTCSSSARIREEERGMGEGRGREGSLVSRET